MRRPLSVAARYLSPARGEARSGLPHQQGRHGQCVSFTYDSDGLRLTKNVDGVEHRYTRQGGKLIAEYWENGKTMEFFYGPDGSIDGFTYKAGPNSSVYAYYYIKNLQGDVVAVVNTNGELRAEYTYDPFGKVLSATGTMADINPIRYRGYYYDQELGFYYLQSRYYDPNLCRFINADGLASTGQGFLGCNMFAYCNNDPVLMCDNTGTVLKISGGPNAISCLIQKMIFLVSLSILSDDKIGFEGDSFTIIEQCEQPVHPVGTELVRRLVTDDNTVTLYYSFRPTENRSRTESEDWVYGKEADSYIQIDATEVQAAAIPLYLVTVHELIHALHFADGTRNPFTEEERARGWGAFADELITEEAIRKEHDYIPRWQN